MISENFHIGLHLYKYYKSSRKCYDGILDNFRYGPLLRKLAESKTDNKESNSLKDSWKILKFQKRFWKKNVAEKIRNKQIVR